MGFPKEIYDKAAAVLSSRRQAAKEQSLRHRQEIYRLLPQIEQIDSQLRRIGMQTIQAVAGSRNGWIPSSSGSSSRAWDCKSSGTTCWKRQVCWKSTATTRTPSASAVRTPDTSARPNANVFRSCCGRQPSMRWELPTRRTAAFPTFRWTIMPSPQPLANGVSTQTADGAGQKFLLRLCTRLFCGAPQL